MAEDEELAVVEARQSPASRKRSLRSSSCCCSQPQRLAKSLKNREPLYECFSHVPLIRAGLCGCSAHQQPPFALQ